MTVKEVYDNAIKLVYTFFDNILIMYKNNNTSEIVVDIILDGDSNTIHSIEILDWREFFNYKNQYDIDFKSFLKEFIKKYNITIEHKSDDYLSHQDDYWRLSIDKEKEHIRIGRSQNKNIHFD